MHKHARKRCRASNYSPHAEFTATSISTSTHYLYLLFIYFILFLDVLNWALHSPDRLTARPGCTLALTGLSNTTKAA